MIVRLIELVAIVLSIVGMWKTFEKAGQPGWAAIIPFYNLYIALVIAGKPIWWMALLILVPVVNLVMAILLGIAFAQKFGKGTGFGVGLALLSFIFFPMLGFGDAKYAGATQQAQGAQA